MIQARIVVDSAFAIGDVDRRLWGTFVEHIGRCVYGGIFEPGHPTADARGFRQDVLALTQELGPTIVRYPGGNFLSGYDWEDGVGPVEQRPRRLDLAWFSTEPNLFGTNEFMDWCRAVGTEPMFCVNLGTRGPDEARRLLEYCNHPGGTQLSNLRRAHGWEQPHAIRAWGLGNELDARWQIGQKTAHDYGRIASESAKLMRWVDPEIELFACGSSNAEMPTFGAWEYEILDHLYEDVDYLSLHMYFRDRLDDYREYQANLEVMDRFIKNVVAICDAVGARKRSAKRIMLSFDEYNVWWKAYGGIHRRVPSWPVAPKINEEVYTMEDALLVGGALITLLNNCDRVKVACLAQLVNVIGAIMTETGGPAWRQTIFHPFAHAARLGRGRVLRTAVDAPSYEARTFPVVSYLLATVVQEGEGRLVVFALNRHPDEDMELTLECRGFGEAPAWRIVEALELAHPDLKATNTRGAPDRVAPQDHSGAEVSDEATLIARLRPASWNVFALQRG